MNLKLVVFIVFCLVLVATAKPAKNKGNKGNKGGKGGKKDKGGPERGLVKLCDGIDDGSIVNTDTAYDSVFTSLEPVCDTLLAFVDDQTNDDDGNDDDGVTDPTAAAFKKNDKGGKKDKKKKNKKGGKKDGEETETKEVNAVKSVLFFCKQLNKAEKKGFPEDLPTEISDVFAAMDPICDSAVEIMKASKTTTTTAAPIS